MEEDKAIDKLTKMVHDALANPLKLIEAGGLMDNNEAKQVLRFALQDQASAAVIRALTPYIDFDSVEDDKDV